MVLFIGQKKCTETVLLYAKLQSYKDWESLRAVLWRIFGPKTEEVIAGYREMLSEELHSLYSLPYIIRVIKTKRIRWARHV